MTPEHAFLQAIRETPDDDDLRMVFADWLEENDDPRGELVRLSVQREQLLERDPAQLDLYRDVSRLMQRDETAWLGPLAGQVSRWSVTRGLLALEVSARPFRDLLARLDPSERVLRWVGGLEPEGSMPEVLSLLQLGRLPLLADLRFPPRSIGLESVRLLAQEKLPVSLHRLGLPNANLGPTALQALEKSPSLAELRELDLENNGIGPEGVGILAESSQFGQLQVLNLRNNSPWHIFISLGDGPPRGGPLGLAAGQALGRSTRLKNLRVLRLWRNQLGPEGAAELTRPGALPALEDLDLSSNGLGRAGAEALAAGGLTRLRSLDVAENNLQDAGLLALLQAPWLGGLTSLRLARNGLSDVGVRMLAETPAVARLRELDLSHNAIGNVGARALVESSFLEGLRCLRLSPALVRRAEELKLRERFGSRLRT